MEDAKVDVSTPDFSGVSMKQSCVCGKIRNILDRDRMSAKSTRIVICLKL